jgi:hypothetical protein
MSRCRSEAILPRSNRSRRSSTSFCCSAPPFTPLATVSRNITGLQSSASFTLNMEAYNYGPPAGLNTRESCSPYVSGGILQSSKNVSLHVYKCNNLQTLQSTVMGWVPAYLKYTEHYHARRKTRWRATDWDSR